MYKTIQCDREQCVQKWDCITVVHDQLKSKLGMRGTTQSYSDGLFLVDMMKGARSASHGKVLHICRDIAFYKNQNSFV